MRKVGSNLGNESFTYKRFPVHVLEGYSLVRILAKEPCQPGRPESEHSTRLQCRLD